MLAYFKVQKRNFAGAIPLLQQAAVLGQFEAHADLAEYYYTGQSMYPGVDQDYDKAARHYTEAMKILVAKGDQTAKEGASRATWLFKKTLKPLEKTRSELLNAYTKGALIGLRCSFGQLAYDAGDRLKAAKHYRCIMDRGPSGYPVADMNLPIIEYDLKEMARKPWEPRTPRPPEMSREELDQIAGPGMISRGVPSTDNYITTFVPLHEKEIPLPKCGTCGKEDMAMKRSAALGQFEAHANLAEYYYTGQSRYPGVNQDYAKAAKHYIEAIKIIVAKEDQTAKEFAEKPACTMVLLNCTDTLATKRAYFNNIPEAVPILRQLFKKTLKPLEKDRSKLLNANTKGALMGLRYLFGQLAYDDGDRQKAAKYYRCIMDRGRSGSSLADACLSNVEYNLKQMARKLREAGPGPPPKKSPKELQQLSEESHKMVGPNVDSSGISYTTEHFTTIVPLEEKEIPLPKCGTCGKEDMSMKRCTGCRKIYYCGADYQKKAWKAHKLICRK
ncbi:hypothetical protein HK102_003532 [Quaeritorhiza haematococci]|nr:hypothetical protein HK102_003532 [Quaeritorhiza haematococci]